MANETTSTNRPPKRVRSFCLSSYLTKSEIAEVLRKHDRQIRAYAYIEHDRDLNEDGTPKPRHIHLLLRTVNSRTVFDIRNWFNGFTDDKGLPVNTLGQEMHDIGSSFEYLTHDTDAAISDGKFRYDPADIISNDVDYFKGTSERDEDNISLAVMDLCNGIPLREVALKYGRDFIIHYVSIKLLFNDIQLQEGGKTIE